MLQKIKRYVFPAAAFVLTLVSSLFWVALRVNYSGISKFLGADTNPSFLVMNLPVMVCVLAWLGCALALLGLVCWNQRKWPAIAGFVIGVVVTVGAVVVVMFGAKDYLYFIAPHFRDSLLVAGGIAAFALLLYFPIRGKNWLKTAVVAAVVIAAVVTGYELRPCRFTCGAVVYAVEDDYQIVFSTSDSAMVWVEIGGESYYDLYAGSMKSWDRVHKVTVPQDVLDAAGGYTVCAKQMIYRGPFGGYTGKTISQTYNFHPVDTSDGLNYVSLSDVHEANDAAIAAASVRGNLDFLVLLGDIVSMVETESDAQAANRIAYGITGGGIPVIYARGNHEIKGEYAEDFYKYVGSKDQEYYYWVTLGEDVFAVVLDLGEDHEDDWWEYYGTAQFDLYRQAQTEFLEEILEDGDYEAYRYRMAICHIPIVYVDEEHHFEGFCNEWTALLNEMEADICLSGHFHKLWQFIPGMVEPYTYLRYTDRNATEGSYLTDITFPGFLVARRSLEQAGGTSDNLADYTCMYTSVDLAAGKQVCTYVNSRGEILKGTYAFTEEPFENIVTEIKRPE